jgi:hypothetical protein
VTTQRFYLEHRLGVTCAREEGEPIPVLTNEDKARQYTKIYDLLLIVDHILQRDDMPLPTCEDGVVELGPCPTTSDFTQAAKIIIYIEFPIFVDLVVNVSLFVMC